MENPSLVADLVAWIAERPRPYGEVMSAWRSSCPRLTIWEDTLAAGLIRLEASRGTQPEVTVTASGLEFLSARDRSVDES